MTLASQIVLRHRDQGHLRFDLPERLSSPQLSELLRQGLLDLDGVYRVDLGGQRGKLSVRFHPEFCSFEQLIRKLHEIVLKLSKHVADSASRVMTTVTTRKTGIEVSVLKDNLLKRIREQLQAFKETLEAMKILIGRSFAHRPRWAKEFMNDLLMLFLIKLHWHHILTEWLPKPWTYRYEWAATLYLIYLSVQARVPQVA